MEPIYLRANSEGICESDVHQLSILSLGSLAARQEDNREGARVETTLLPRGQKKFWRLSRRDHPRNGSRSNRLSAPGQIKLDIR